MPSLDAHLAAARSNFDLMTYLRTNRSRDRIAAWVASRAPFLHRGCTSSKACSPNCSSRSGSSTPQLTTSVATSSATSAST